MGDWQRRRSLSFFVAGLCYLLAAKLPRFGASERMVRGSGDGPSMLVPRIADGSGFKGWTFHAGATYRGWFGVQVLNPPRLVPISRTVRVSRVEPSTLEVDIADGSMSRAGPSTLVPRIADSSGVMY